MLAAIKNALKKYSVQGMTIAAAIQVAWMTIPATLQQLAPDWVTHTAVLAFLAYGLIGRFVPQASVSE